MESLEKYLQVCEQAVRLGGAAVQRGVGKIEVQKKGPADLVTQADFASQEVITGLILAAFPNHSVVGEEDLLSSAMGTGSRYRWIVDPLDGTTNYVHGVPHYSVSLALEREGDLLVGAVWDPLLQECFTAAKGQGARLNGRPIHTSRVTDVSEALGVVGFPPDLQRDSPDLQVFLEAVFHCQSVRRSGSTALNLSYLAAGRYDVFWTFSSRCWDLAAGVLLLREAGGVICGPGGEDFSLQNPQFLSAANPPLLKQLQEIVNRALRKDGPVNRTVLGPD